MRRIDTGISGLNELIDGGIPEESIVLVSGGAGCGKTILTSQFIWEGLQKGDKCTFITLEQKEKDIITDANDFGWNFKPYIDEGQLNLEYINPVAGRGFLDQVLKYITGEDVERVAIDSISILLSAYENNTSKMRETLYDIVRRIKREGPTTLITSEIPEKEDESLSRYGISEFVADGVIVLYYTGVGEESFRNIEIRKMRRTAHRPGTFPFKIDGERGIIVRKNNRI